MLILWISQICLAKCERELIFCHKDMSLFGHRKPYLICWNVYSFHSLESRKEFFAVSMEMFHLLWSVHFYFLSCVPPSRSHEDVYTSIHLQFKDFNSQIVSCFVCEVFGFLTLNIFCYLMHVMKTQRKCTDFFILFTIIFSSYIESCRGWLKASLP